MLQLRAVNHVLMVTVVVMTTMLGSLVQAQSSAVASRVQVAPSRIDSIALTVPQCGHRKRVWVYLPRGFVGDGQTRYPVLYMQDGQDLFEPTPIFTDNPYILDSMRQTLGQNRLWYGNWQVDRRLDELFAERGLDGIIVVGVSSDGGDRTAEYSPWPWSGTSAAEGEDYADFVVHTLKPYIDRTYPTRGERAHTGIGGSSMGGLIALYIGLKYQSVFSKVAAFSPLITEGPPGRQLVEDAGRRGKAYPMKIYVDLGTEESSFGPLEPLHATLKKAGFGAEELWFRRVEGGMHRIDHWGQRFPEALLWLYVDESPETSTP